MAKIVNCEDCIYMYHCGRTYLGGCDTGVEFGENKKGGDADEGENEEDKE